MSSRYVVAITVIHASNGSWGCVCNSQLETAEVTLDEREVTCKRCRRILAHRTTR